MKTRFWVLLLAAVFLLAAAACLLLCRPAASAKSVRVLSDGKLVAVLDLSEDTVLTVPYKDGSNTVTVSGGKVSVTDASCPDHTCMAYGEKSGGTPIICLPNRLVLEFSDTEGLDAVAK